MVSFTGGQVVSMLYCYAGGLPLESHILPLLKHAYGEWQLAAMLSVKRLAGVAPDVNLREHTSCIPLPSGKKAAHSGFEAQRRHHQKFKTGVAP